jgi:hypothetical protein
MYGESLPQRKVSNDFRTAHMERAGVIGSAVSGGIMSDASHDDLNDLKRRPHANNDHMPENHEAPARGGANPSAAAR